MSVHPGSGRCCLRPRAQSGSRSEPARRQAPGNRDVAVDRREVLTSFLRKTIYEPSPGVARQLLLDLPLLALKAAWSKYIVVPIQGVIEFDEAVDRFQAIVNELFAAYASTDRASFAFFPSGLRTPIMEAGADRRLIPAARNRSRALSPCCEARRVWASKVLSTQLWGHWNEPLPVSLRF